METPALGAGFRKALSDEQVINEDYKVILNRGPAVKAAVWKNIEF